MNTSLTRYLNERATEFDRIDPDRKKALQPLVDYILTQQRAHVSTQLNFICTHNSRRSQMAQLWCAAACEFVELGEIFSFSGGTEASAFYPAAIQAMNRSGFNLEAESEEINPRYFAQLGTAHMLEMFSKRFDDEANPNRDFAAIMVCSDADENCPFVPGCDKRISLPFEDPKSADGTAQETKVYDERCAQIARELLYVLTQVNQHV